jgi:hypothetical protein
MSVTKEEAYQHALCMDLTTDKLRCAFVHTSTKKITSSLQFDLHDFSREGIQDFLKEDYFSFDYSTISVSAGSRRNTLMPFDLFNHSKAEDIFALNYPKPFDGVDYNRIPELGIVNIYEFPVWMKSLFVIRFPRIKLLHRSTVLLKAVFDQPTFSGKVHLLIEKEQFYMIIVHKSKLLYFNRFDIKAFSDLVYHLHFVLEQKELDTSDFDFRLYGVNEDWEHLKEFTSLCPGKVKLDKAPESSSDLILAKQLLCV